MAESTDRMRASQRKYWGGMLQRSGTRLGALKERLAAIQDEVASVTSIHESIAEKVAELAPKADA